MDSNSDSPADDSEDVIYPEGGSTSTHTAHTPRSIHVTDEKSRITAMTGGNSMYSMAFHNVRDVNITREHRKDKDQAGANNSLKDDSPAEDMKDGRVTVTISGRRSEPIPPLDMLPVVIKDGDITVRGRYDSTSITTKASCDKGVIIQLETNIKPGTEKKCICHTLWTLDGEAIDDIATTLSVSHGTIYELKERIERLYDAVLKRLAQGSLKLEFGHFTRADAERMVREKDNVRREIQTVLTAHNMVIEDLCLNVEINVDSDDDSDDTNESVEKEDTTFSLQPPAPKMEKKMYEPTEAGSSGYHSMSTSDDATRKETGEVTEEELERILKDEEVAACERCTGLRSDRDEDHVCNILVVHLEEWYIMPLRLDHHQRHLRKTRRLEKTEEIKHKVSALRNNGGGTLYLHLNDLKGQVDYLLEMIEYSLLEMLKPGELFGDIYKKTEDMIHNEFIQLAVAHSSEVLLSRMSSKTPCFGQLTEITHQQLCHLLFENRAVANKLPVIKGIANISHEDIDTEFKSFTYVKQYVDITQHILSGLRLREYISAFTKNANGGSLYVGIEQGHKRGLIQTGVPMEAIQDKTMFTRRLKQMIEESMMVINNVNQKEQYDLKELAEVGFHDVGNENYVIEVAVRPVYGCVFTNKNGPSAYKLNENCDIVRMSPEECLERLKSGN